MSFTIPTPGPICLGCLMTGICWMLAEWMNEWSWRRQQVQCSEPCSIHSAWMLFPGGFQLISYLWVLLINQRQIGNTRNILAKITGTEFLFTWPNDFLKKSIFHHSDCIPDLPFAIFWFQATMMTLTIKHVV